jgi:hypothetical protein
MLHAKLQATVFNYSKTPVKKTRSIPPKTLRRDGTMVKYRTVEKSIAQAGGEWCIAPLILRDRLDKLKVTNLLKFHHNLNPITLPNCKQGH